MDNIKVSYRLGRPGAALVLGMALLLLLAALVAGSAAAQALSTDATLSDLSVKDSAGGAITLSPVFATATKSYTATAANRMDRITIDPSVNHSGATVAYFDVDDNALSDADSGEDDFQVNIDIGDNTVKVKVTAEDDNTTDTYQVVVTREAAATGYPIISATFMATVTL